jgi:hypothetical protein
VLNHTCIVETKGATRRLTVRPPEKTTKAQLAQILSAVILKVLLLAVLQSRTLAVSRSVNIYVAWLVARASVYRPAMHHAIHDGVCINGLVVKMKQ